MILKGEKATLRPIKMADAPRFVKWLSDPEANKFTTRKSITLKEEKAWIEKLPGKIKQGELQFAIDTEKKVHIGSIGMQINKRDKNASMGIFIGDKNYWDKHYGTDAIKVIMRYGFNKLKLHKITLSGGGVYAYNPRAINVYKNLGFKKEGVNRESVFYKGKFYDSITMGILRREWLLKNK